MSFLGWMSIVETCSPSQRVVSWITPLYVYQLYNFTLSNMLFLKGSHISLRIASCRGSPTAISICLVSDNIKNKWARTNILPLSTVMKFPSVILQCSHYTEWGQAIGPLFVLTLFPTWLTAVKYFTCFQLVNHSQTVNLWLGWMRNISACNHYVGKLWSSSVTVSIGQQRKGICSLALEAVHFQQVVALFVQQAC